MTAELIHLAFVARRKNSFTTESFGCAVHKGIIWTLLRVCVPSDASIKLACIETASAERGEMILKEAAAFLGVSK